MKTPIRILVVEDNPSDSDLLVRTLRRAGMEVDAVVSEDLREIHGLLGSRVFDAILSDHQLAGFTASDVLSAAADHGLDVPFLVVSGAVGEDRAAELMREGASDFIRKDNLARLEPALRRELREAAGRRRLLDAVERRARSESLLRFVVELSGDSFWEWDLSTGMVVWSETFLALCGGEAPPPPEIGAWRARIHPEDRDEVVAGIDATIASEGVQWSGSFRFRRAEGNWALLMARCFVVREEGRAVRVIGAMADITERQALVDRQRAFTAIVDQSGESVAVIDPDTGRFLEFNSTAHGTLGHTREEFAAMTVFDIDCRIPHEEIARRLAELKDEDMRDFATRHRCRDGSVREVRIRSRPIRLQGHTYIAAVWQDVTERMAIEAELRQAQKMEILGQIAGGVAHDFNNVLAAMRLHLELAQMGTLGSGEFPRFVEGLSQMVDRAATLTRRLLSISRKGPPKTEEFQLDDALDDLIAVSRRLLGAGIEIRRTRSPGRLMVVADRSIMDQVFMNLFVNARDAMPKGGVLSVDSRVVEVQPEAGVPAGAWAGRRFIQIRVGDTGTGMSKETLTHIHEPFFTTKEPGRGTGLGLSAVRRSLQEHGGWMSVESEEGKGTVFTLHLPLGPSGAADDAGRSDDAPPGPPRVLLVVEDPQLRVLARKVLEKMGCHATACADAEEALEVLEPTPQALHLALFPAGMTLQRSGVSLALRVRESLPGLPLILTRASSDPARPAPAVPSRFLEMPFSISSLTLAVAESLPDHTLHPLR